MTLLGQLRHGLCELVSRALRYLRPSTYTSPEGDIEREADKVRRVADALRRLK